MIVERLTKPATLAFVLADLKTHCRVTAHEDNQELVNHGQAAVAELEAYAQIALIDQTIRLTLDGWPRSNTLALPIGPVIDALSVVVTADGLAFDAFGVITGQRPALRLADFRPCGVIVIQYLAGFGPVQTDIPADLINAIHDQAAAFFDTKGAGDGKTNGMSPHLARIAARYRRVSL